MINVVQSISIVLYYKSKGEEMEYCKACGEQLVDIAGSGRYKIQNVNYVVADAFENNVFEVECKTCNAVSRLDLREELGWIFPED